MDREILTQGVIDSFLDGNYRTVKTTEEITVYRVFGGNAKSTGSFVTINKAISRIDAKIDMALLPEWKNTRMDEAEIIIPKGQQINIGENCTSSNRVDRYNIKRRGIVGDSNTTRTKCFKIN
ncbi:hypothetical protein AB3U68_002178 [Listeria monocytogenes]